MLISEAVIHRDRAIFLDLHNSSCHTQAHSVISKYLSHRMEQKREKHVNCRSVCRAETSAMLIVSQFYRLQR